MNNKHPGIRRSIFSSMILAGGLTGSVVGHAAVLDFEGFARGQIIDDEYVEEGVRISAYNRRIDGDGLAVVFDTANTGPRSTEADLGGPFTSADGGDPYDAGNILVIQNEKFDVCADPASGFCDEPNDESKGGAFTFDFSAPVTLFSLDFFDIEESENAGNPDSEILMYGDDDSLLATFFVPATGGDNTWGRLFFDNGISGVSRLVVELEGSGAIDNLEFEMDDQDYGNGGGVTVVPVPAAAWLFGSGLLGLLGVTVRRKRAG